MQGVFHSSDFARCISVFHTFDFGTFNFGDYLPNEYRPAKHFVHTNILQLEAGIKFATFLREVRGGCREAASEPWITKCTFIQ